MNNWPFTNLGMRFFEGTLPSLVRAIEHLAKEIQRFNDLVERRSDFPCGVVKVEEGDDDRVP